MTQKDRPFDVHSIIRWNILLGIEQRSDSPSGVRITSEGPFEHETETVRPSSVCTPDDPCFWCASTIRTALLFEF